MDIFPTQEKIGYTLEILQLGQFHGEWFHNDFYPLYSKIVLKIDIIMNA